MNLDLVNSEAAAILFSGLVFRSPLSGYHHYQRRLRAVERWSDEYEQQRVRGQGPPRGWSPPARAAARRGGTSPRSCRVRGNTGGTYLQSPAAETRRHRMVETIMETTLVIASVR